MNTVVKRLEERHVRLLNKEIKRLEHELWETKGDYAETGYGWSFNKINRLEKELKEVIAYRDKDEQLRQEKIVFAIKKRELEEKLNNLRSKVLFLICDLRDMGICYAGLSNLETFLDNFKL